MIWSAKDSHRAGSPGCGKKCAWLYGNLQLSSRTIRGSHTRSVTTLGEPKISHV